MELISVKAADRIVRPVAQRSPGGQSQPTSSGALLTFRRGPIPDGKSNTAGRPGGNTTSANRLTQAADIAPPLRKFVDSTGQFKIRAKFTRFIDGQVYLEKMSGEVITLSMNKLSEADQKYIQDYLKGQR